MKIKVFWSILIALYALATAAIVVSCNGIAPVALSGAARPTTVSATQKARVDARFASQAQMLASKRQKVHLPSKRKHTLAELQKIPGAAKVLSKDGTVSKSVIPLKTASYAKKDASGNVTMVAVNLTPPPAGALAPVIVTPPLPSDFGTTFDASANILYTNGTEHIGTGPVIWPNIHDAHCSDIQQWQVADCYALAAWASLADAHPAILRNLIRRNAQGGFDSNFILSSGQKLIVRTTDGLLSQNVGAKVNLLTGATWAAEYERAYAYARTYDGTASQNTLASLNYGFPGPVYLAAGCQQQTYSVQMPGWASIACSWINSGTPISVCTDGNAGGIFVDAHCYYVYDYFTDSNGTLWFILYNPWGIDGPGPTDGTDDGFVTRSAAQIQQWCSSITGATTFPADPAPQLAGDVNDDGVADLQDEAIITNHWQFTTANQGGGVTFFMSDLNRDGVTDLQDLSIVTNAEGNK